MQICKKILFDYLNYYFNYYGSSYKKNQGIDTICKMLTKYCNGNSWLDLGGGCNTVFWSNFINANYIVSIDRYKEAKIASEIIYKFFIQSDCEIYLRNLLNLDRNKIQQKFNIKYIAKDLLNQRINMKEKFDVITQFGLFGLCKNQNEYIEKVFECLQLLNINGVYFGANWIFSESYSHTMGFSNNYLYNIDLKVPKPYSIISRSILNIENDSHYKHVLLYIIRRN